MSFEYLCEILAFCLLASQVLADTTLNSFDIYSGNDCGSDADNLNTELSTSIDVWDSSQLTTNCGFTQIKLRNWPQQHGKYIAFLDTSPIGPGCSLILFDGPPTGDDDYSQHCFENFQMLNSTAGCAPVFLPVQFGSVYCCGEECDSMPAMKRAVTPALVKPRDVAQVKRASILRPRDNTCTFTKTSDEVKTLFGKPKKASAQQNCPIDSLFGCTVAGDFSTTTTISHTTGSSNSVGFSVSLPLPFFSISGSYGHEWSSSDENSDAHSFSISYSQSIDAGDNAYLSFTPKMLCGTGTFSGDGCGSGLLIGDSEWCIPALIDGANSTTQPDGVWSMVLTN